jgi:pilus assembly protein Flp/PilA
MPAARLGVMLTGRGPSRDRRSRQEVAHMPEASRRNTRERGASAVEYSVLVVLIAAVVVGTVTVLGGQVTDLFDSLIGLF